MKVYRYNEDIDSHTWVPFCRLNILMNVRNLCCYKSMFLFNPIYLKHFPILDVCMRHMKTIFVVPDRATVWFLKFLLLFMGTMLASLSWFLKSCIYLNWFWATYANYRPQFFEISNVRFCCNSLSNKVLNVYNFLKNYVPTY